MADTDAKLEITPKVIDLGDKVIQLSHVTSAGHGATHPLRPVGLLLIAAAVGLIGFEVASRGPAAFALRTSGSLLLWLGFASAGIGLFLALYARRLLVIRTSDGGRTVLASGSDNASAAVVGRIREAMEAAGGHAATGHAPPMQLPAAAPLEVAARLGAERGMPPGVAAQPAAQPQLTSQPAYTQPLAGRRPPDSHLNGHGGAGYANGTGRPDAGHGEPGHAGGLRPLAQQQPHVQQQQQQALQAGMAARSAHAVHTEPPQPLALPAAAPRDDSSRELHLLMEHVRRADVQHKEALLDLLRVVEDHYRGRASRDDAVAHWRSFADYVMQYLSDVDGMMAHTERFGRHMLSR